MAKQPDRYLNEFSFKPKINKISEEIEKRNWQFRMQLERQRDNFLNQEHEIERDFEENDVNV